MRACEYGYLEIAKLLLDNGAKVDLKDEDGWNAFIFACYNGYLEIAKLLLDNGAEVNSVNNDHLTGLIYVCKHGDYKIAKLLLDNGADPTMKDVFLTADPNIQGNTAMDYAKDNEHDDIIKLLEKHIKTTNPKTK